MLQLFTFLAGSSFLLAGSGYFALWLVIPDDSEIGVIYHIFKYHWSHPVHQLGLVSLCYALVASLFILSPPDPVRRWPKASTVSIVILSLIIATPAGGVLWVFHDMRAGYVPGGLRFWENIWWGAKYATSISWLVILLSFPYNILGIFLGHLVTRRAYEMTLAAPAAPGDLPKPSQGPIAFPAKRWRQNNKAAPGNPDAAS